MRVALYMRRSTNEELQADSLRVQEEILRSHATNNGHEIVAVYAESASGRTYEKRDEFQRLIDDVKRGADFDGVLVRDVSRWGRFENADEAAFYEFFCIQHKVSVIYVEEHFGPADSPYAALLKSMKRVLAAEFSREKSRLVTRGKERARSLGFHAGGPPPYGMKRILVTPDGQLVQELPPGTHKIVSNLRTKLVAAETEETDIVRRIFRMFLDEGKAPTAIARTLNAEGVPSPRGRRWRIGNVIYVLKNVAYAYAPSSGEAQRPRGSPDGLVVTATDWAAAHERRATTARTNRSASEWREIIEGALHRRGHLDASLVTKMELDVAAQRIAKSPGDALTVLFAEELLLLRSRLLEALQTNFRVESDGSTFLVNGFFRIALRFSFPILKSLHRFWKFKLPPVTEADAALCVGLEVNLLPIPALLTMRRTATTPCLRRSRVSSTQAGEENQWKHVTTQIRRLLTSSPSFDAVFAACVERYGGAYLHLMSHELGVSRKALELYCDRKGVDVIQGRKPAEGSRELKCSSCGKARIYPASRIAARVTDLCRSCHFNRPKNSSKINVKCTRCGTERLLFPSTLKKSRKPFRCHVCSMLEGRLLRKEQNDQRREPRQKKLSLLRDLALIVVGKMKSEERNYEAAAARRLRENALPQLIWRSPKTEQRFRLVLDCDDAFVVACEAASHSAPREPLANAVLNPANWRGGELSPNGERQWRVVLC